jgi:hypothetical protein
MYVIDVLSFNIGADDDIKYGCDKLTKSHIGIFIDFYKITDQLLINYLISFIDSFDCDILTQTTKHNETYTHPDIVSYHLISSNLTSITIKINNKIRYLTSYDPEIIENFIEKKKNTIYQYIVDSNIDIICLQNYDDPYIIDDFYDYKQITWHTSTPNYDETPMGMLSNCILYKPITLLNIKIECMNSYFTEYGLVANFNISSEKIPTVFSNINIISGIWSLHPRLTNILQQDNKCWQLNKMHMELNKTNYAFVGSIDKTFATNEFTKHQIPNANFKANISMIPTINKNKNKYYSNCNFESHVSYADYIYTNNIDLIQYDLILDQPFEHLINIYRPSGYLSDHFGLYFGLLI